jgi:metallo-beta-lactamase family protein
VERKREIRIFGETHRLRAEVEVMNAYSAHADEPELVRFVGPMDRQRLKRIFLVHGDPERQIKLFEALRADGPQDAHAPERGEVEEL